MAVSVFRAGVFRSGVFRTGSAPVIPPIVETLSGGAAFYERWRERPSGPSARQLVAKRQTRIREAYARVRGLERWLDPTARADIAAAIAEAVEVPIGERLPRPDRVDWSWLNVLDEDADALLDLLTRAGAGAARAKAKAKPLARFRPEGELPAPGLEHLLGLVRPASSPINLRVPAMPQRPAIDPVAFQEAARAGMARMLEQDEEDALILAMAL